jgi:hypothetical protein
MEAKELFVGMSDPVLSETIQAALEVARARQLEIPGVLGTLTVSETTTLEATTSEAVETIPLQESLLDSFDTAYGSYSNLVRDANMRRDQARGRKKPEQLQAVDADTIRADVEAVLANPGVVAELQAEVDRARAYPEVDGQEAGFDLVIVPEGLTKEDVNLAAHRLQQELNPDYNEAYIRPEAFNDKRTPAVTGKGYRIAFAPTHYNVPGGIASTQTKWMEGKNQSLTATELQTATDAEALAFIDGLNANDQLDDSNTRFDRSYFRRFDQTPRDGCVSRVVVLDRGRLILDGSLVHRDYPTRALVVPKAQA